MNALIGFVILLVIVIVAVKLLGLALKVAGILLVAALVIGGIAFAQKKLRGPGGA